MSTGFTPLFLTTEDATIERRFTWSMEEVMGEAISIEEELISRSLAGDNEAFSRLVGENERFVFNIAYRILGDRDLALDITQDVFLILFENLNRFRRRSSLRSWLYRVVVNRSLNEAKQKRRYLFFPLSGKERSASSTSPERKVLGRELMTRLEEGLKLLPPDFRAVIVLRDIEGLSYDEIADVLSIRKGTVKSRLARAREGMRDFLRPYLEPRLKREGGLR